MLHKLQKDLYNGTVKKKRKFDRTVWACFLFKNCIPHFCTSKLMNLNRDGSCTKFIEVMFDSSIFDKQRIGS